MKTITIPRTQIYIGEGQLYAEWHGDEHYRAEFQLDTDSGDDLAILVDVIAIRDSESTVEGVGKEFIPEGVKSYISKSYVIGEAVDDSDDEPDHVGRDFA